MRVSPTIARVLALSFAIIAFVVARESHADNPAIDYVSLSGTNGRDDTMLQATCPADGHDGSCIPWDNVYYTVTPAPNVNNPTVTVTPTSTPPGYPPTAISSGDVEWCTIVMQCHTGGGLTQLLYDSEQGGTACQVDGYASGCDLADYIQVDVGVSRHPGLRVQNAYTGNGTFYLGIPGGPQNNRVADNLDLVVWQSSQSDQLWFLPQSHDGPIWDANIDLNGSNVCVAVSGGVGAGNGAPMIDQPCDPSNPSEAQMWEWIPSDQVGQGSQYPGCYILFNAYTSKAIGVSGGNGNVKNGGSVIQWDYDGTANQFWCANLQ